MYCVGLAKRDTSTQEYCNDNIQAYGLMVAEYRLSLFAPTLAVKGRASVKKLEAAAELLINNA